MNHLSVSSLHVAFGKRTVIDDLSFKAKAGTITALTGRSGSGKSTLLNVVGLLERADQGHVTFGGTNITGMSGRRTRQFRRAALGYLFQNYGLIETTTIQHNLEVVGRKYSRPEALKDAMARVGLEMSVKTPVSQLSGGEQQRVALARLILKRPQLVLADEPTGALDDDNATRVIETLRSFADDGALVLVATHSAAVADSCDERLHLAAN